MAQIAARLLVHGCPFGSWGGVRTENEETKASSWGCRQLVHNFLTIQQSSNQMILQLRVWSLAALVAGAAFAADIADNNNNNNTPEQQHHRNLPSNVNYCRCEAEFENFYGRRLREASRKLSYPYDYSDSYVDSDGYSIVEGVRVLPEYECHATSVFAPRGGGVAQSVFAPRIGGVAQSSSQTNNALSGWLGMFGNRLLGEQERSDEDYDTEDDAFLDEDEEVEKLMLEDEDEFVIAGHRDLKGSSKGYHYDYYHGGGKGTWLRGLRSWDGLLTLICIILKHFNVDQLTLTLIHTPIINR